MVSPYRKFGYTMGDTTVTELDKIAFMTRIKSTFKGATPIAINKGIHSFVNPDDAAICLERINMAEYERERYRPIDYLEVYADGGLEAVGEILKLRWNADNNIYGVFECIIPKGSRYYRGLWESSIGPQESIASDQLKVVRILD